MSRVLTIGHVRLRGLRARMKPLPIAQAPIGTAVAQNTQHVHLAADEAIHERADEPAGILRGERSASGSACSARS
jgi:hypothetical protein